MSWHHDSCCTTITIPAPFITSLEPASGRCRFSSKWIVHIIIFKRVKIFAKNLVLEVETLSEQFGQFVNGQLVNYQDLTPDCRAAVVPTLATATTSVMEPGATAPQHGEEEVAWLTVVDVVTVSVHDNVLMWTYEMMMLAKCSWCNICDIAPRMNENQDNLVTADNQCCMHVSQKMCL